MSITTTTAASEPEYITFFEGGKMGKRPILSGSDLKPSFDHIPTIDFGDLKAKSQEERLRIAAEIRQAFTDVGFFYAANHGISKSLEADVRRVMEEFFSLPMEEKMKVHARKSPYFRGYEQLLETKFDKSGRGDLKEGYTIGEDPNEPEQEVPANLDWSLYPKEPMNNWPENPKDFRKVMSEYKNAVLAFSRELLRLIAISLDMEEDFFSKLTEFPMAALRPLHYPPQELTSDVGIGAHADYSWFTLVNQLSPTPALEVLNHNGHWVSAPPIPNTLVVNVGDFLKRATNDVFQSTVHRVVNRSTVEDRYSIPYFFNPTQGAVIETIPTCITAERPAKYEPMPVLNWQAKKKLLMAQQQKQAN